MRVAPFAGAWIEITNLKQFEGGAVVAPFAGAWIEISTRTTQKIGGNVAPFAGAWIEIGVKWIIDHAPLGRSLHWNV